MESGKPAGVRCIHLNESNLCNLFNKPDRPKVCGGFQADLMFCGSSADEARINIINLERLTS
jgi:hypothetical protein